MGDRPTQSLRLEQDGVSALSFSPKGDVLAVGQGQSIGLWNVKTGERIKAMMKPRGQQLAWRDQRLWIGNDPQGVVSLSFSGEYLRGQVCDRLINSESLASRC